MTPGTRPREQAASSFCTDACRQLQEALQEGNGLLVRVRRLLRQPDFFNSLFQKRLGPGSMPLHVVVIRLLCFRDLLDSLLGELLGSHKIRVSRNRGTAEKKSDQRTADYRLDQECSLHDSRGCLLLGIRRLSRQPDFIIRLPEKLL